MSPLSRCGSSIDHLIHGIARLNHQHYATRALQGPDKFLNRMSARDLRSGGFVLNEFVYLRNSAVEDGHSDSRGRSYSNQVLSHHGQADQTKVTTFLLHKTPVECIFLPGRLRGWKRRLLCVNFPRFHLGKRRAGRNFEIFGRVGAARVEPSSRLS